MTLDSYGDFGKLPREIRDLIYENYFFVDTPATLVKHWRALVSEPILYVTGPDTSLLRASRALYRESLPVWKNHYRRRKLFRIVANVSTAEQVQKSLFLTLSVHATPTSPPLPRAMLFTWFSNRWLHTPTLYGPAYSELERARIVFPNLQCILNSEKSELNRTMELFAKIIGTCSRRVLGLLNISIEDTKWPLPQVGEDVWYKRLHRGMTRRSLMKELDTQLEIIIKPLSDIILLFQKVVTIVTFTFGDNRNGRYRDTTGVVTRIVAILKKKVRGIAISIEYTPYFVYESFSHGCNILTQSVSVSPISISDN